MELTNTEKLEAAASHFQTGRLSLDNNREGVVNEAVKSILTPAVTKYLPDGWQNLTSQTDIENWIADRASEGAFLNIRLGNDVVGFCFIYVPEDAGEKLDIRFGYLLSEHVWGKGIGTEFIEGLIKWCSDIGYINSLAGGVEVDNKGSIRVLEKNGFVQESSNGDTLFYRKDFKA